MQLTRVYVDAELLTGQTVAVDDSAANHIGRVLRLGVGDPLTLFNGRGGEYAARIAEIRRDTVLVDVLEHRPLERESSFRVTLAQGISRGERMDWVVQKATELGVARIAPLFTQRSVVHLDERQASRKLQHWRAIAIAACEQCGRNTVPEITAPMDLEQFLRAPPADPPSAHTRAAAALLLSPSAQLRIGELQIPACGATVLIGPEGGLAQTERQAATSLGFVPVRVGPRVLRTETAAVCALSLLQQRFGDL